MVSRPVLEAAIATYNDYHSPMATAELREISETGFAVRFEGPFCRMCCDYDYFEDLIYELPDYGVDPDTVEVRDVAYEPEERFLVRFRHRS